MTYAPLTEAQRVDLFDRLHRVFGERMFPANGTLLGLIRGGGFLSWDHDVDAAVMADEFIDTDLQALTDVGFTKVKARRWVDDWMLDRVGRDALGQVTFITLKLDGIHSDVRVYWPGSDGFSYFRRYDNTMCRVPTRLLSERIPATFGDWRITIPARSHDLLEWWYGSTWQQPNARWHRSRDRERAKKRWLVRAPS